MNNKLYFTLSMLFILLIALFLWPNSDVFAWSDPSCAPPGCNRPQPITVEGGTILTGNTLNVSEGADFITGDIVIDSTGIEIGGKIEANKSGLIGKYYVCTSVGEIVTCVDTLIDTLVNTYLNELLVVDSDILVTENHTLNLSGGNSALYIDEGRDGPWGYGIYAKAHKAVSNETTMAVYAVTPIQDGNMESWLYGEPIAVLADATAPSFNGYGVKAVIDGSVYVEGAFPPGDGKAAIYAIDQSGITADNGGYHTLAIKSEGNVDIKLIRSNDINAWGQTFTVRSANTAPGGGCSGEFGWCNNVLKIEASRTTYGLDNIVMEADVYIGGTDIDSGQELGTHQLCLNDPGDSSNCITDWADIEVSGGGNNNTYKTFNPDNGDSPQAASASDTLNIIDGANINVVGFDGNNNQDSITINVNTTLTDIVQINSVLDDFLYLNGGDAEGVYVYDKLTVDGDVQVNDLTANCANVTTNAQKELTCGIDAVNDADSSVSNEIQSLDQVLKVDNSSSESIELGNVFIYAGNQLCIGNTCLTESQLAALLLLLK